MIRLSGWDWLQLPIVAIIIIIVSQVGLLILKVNGVLWGAISWWWIISPIYVLIVALIILVVLWAISKRSHTLKELKK